MLRFKVRFLLWMLLLVGTSCVESYEPQVIRAATSYLVIDGFINGNGITSIRLTRSVNLASTTAFPPETGATVSIEAESGLTYALREQAPGEYVSGTQRLKAGARYRLHLRTATGREYASDYSALKITPPIDQLTGRVQSDGVQVLLSAHDETGQSQYYRWHYEETWEFTSAFESLYVYKGNNRVARRANDIYHCWRTEAATAIHTTSTVRLRQDAVRDYRLLFIPAADGRLRHKYSLLVRQYALSQPEFAYWEALKKNTETLGTLFDPLPSQLQGNVHCLSDPTEPVLGFVGAASLVEKRLFIDRTQLPNDWIFVSEEYKQCSGLDTFPNANKYAGYTLHDMFSDSTYRMPVGRLAGTNGYTMQTQDCVDCRLRGTNIKPSFWP